VRHRGRTNLDAIGCRKVTGFRCKIKGTPSHAAHQNNDAIYKTIPVMEWFKIIISKSIRSIRSGKMTVTQVNAGNNTWIVPSECDIVVDIRVNDCYTNQEVLAIVKSMLMPK
jgi:acetylornithine deacetylase